MNLIALEGFSGGGSLNLNFPPPFSHEVGRGEGGGREGGEANVKLLSFSTYWIFFSLRKYTFASLILIQIIFCTGYGRAICNVRKIIIKQQKKGNFLEP
jgi:hypothetical protein